MDQPLTDAFDPDDARSFFFRIEQYPFESLGGDLRLCRDWHEFKNHYRLLAAQLAECQQELIAWKHTAISADAQEQELDSLEQQLAAAHEQLARCTRLTCEAALNLSHVMEERDALRLRITAVDAEHAEMERQKSVSSAAFQSLEYERDALKAELARFKTMSTIEMMCENPNVDSHVREWEARCVKSEARVEKLTASNARLRVVCDEILKIMTVYHEQERSSDGVDTPGGLKHMGDVWGLFLKWEDALSARRGGIS